MEDDRQQKSRQLVLDEAELRSRLADTRAQMARLRVIEGQLMTALDLFDTSAVSGSAATPPAMPSRAKTTSRPSQREVILQVLAEAEGPISVSALAAAVSERVGQVVERTSISPALAKLRQAGEVAHSDEGWTRSGM